MSGVLDGRVALIAGSGRGIGRAIALAYAAEGARLVLLSRTRADLDRTAEACRAAGAPSVRAVLADVADRDAAHASVDGVLAAEGVLDALVISSGVYGPIAPVAALDLDAWRASLAINLEGPLYLLHAALPHMIARGRGKVIVLAGGGATQPMPAFSAYAAAKAGLVRLVETVALEVADAGVQVNAVSPGLVDTGLQDDVIAAGEVAGAIGDRIRHARETGEGTVDAAVGAALALFLASDASGAVTGKLISAPYDDWRDWPARAEALNASDWFTLRRIDPHTVDRLPREPH